MTAKKPLESIRKRSHTRTQVGDDLLPHAAWGLVSAVDSTSIPAPTGSGNEDWGPVQRVFMGSDRLHIVCSIRKEPIWSPERDDPQIPGVIQN